MINKTLFFILTLFISVSQAQQVRHTETINDLWDFHKGSLSKPFLNKEDNSWEKVNIPHSWNTQDILDDQDGYYRGDGWYKKTLTIPQVYKNQHVFLLFEAANQVTTLYVNGKQIEKEHIGGYTTFARDITNAVKSGENSIMIKVNNAHNDEIVPQAADFSFYGGIYRDIQLIITKPVHFQVANLGANSVFITTPGVSKTTSKVAVKSKLNRPKKGDFLVRHTLYDAQDNLIKNVVEPTSYGKEQISEFTVNTPKLWSPEDPYLYKLVSEIINKKEEVLDRNTS